MGKITGSDTVTVPMPRLDHPRDLAWISESCKSVDYWHDPTPAGNLKFKIPGVPGHRARGPAVHGCSRGPEPEPGSHGRLSPGRSGPGKIALVWPGMRGRSLGMSRHRSRARRRARTEGSTERAAVAGMHQQNILYEWLLTSRPPGRRRAGSCDASGHCCC